MVDSGTAIITLAGIIGSLGLVVFLQIFVKPTSKYIANLLTALTGLLIMTSNNNPTLNGVGIVILATGIIVMVNDFFNKPE